jgi:hypothetical protein
VTWSCQKHKSEKPLIGIFLRGTLWQSLRGACRALFLKAVKLKNGYITKKYRRTGVVFVHERVSLPDSDVPKVFRAILKFSLHRKKPIGRQNMTICRNACCKNSAKERHAGFGNLEISNQF